MCVNLVGAHQEKRSALHIAVMADDVDIIQHLLQAKADVNLLDGSTGGRTPLALAQLHKKEKAAAELCKHGAKGALVYACRLVAENPSPSPLQLQTLLLKELMDLNECDEQMKRVNECEEVVRFIRVRLFFYLGLFFVCVCAYVSLHGPTACMCSLSRHLVRHFVSDTKGFRAACPPGHKESSSALCGSAERS